MVWETISVGRLVWPITHTVPSFSARSMAVCKPGGCTRGFEDEIVVFVCVHLVCAVRDRRRQLLPVGLRHGGCQSSLANSVATMSPCDPAPTTSTRSWSRPEVALHRDMRDDARFQRRKHLLRGPGGTFQANRAGTVTNSENGPGALIPTMIRLVHILVSPRKHQVHFMHAMLGSTMTRSPRETSLTSGATSTTTPPPSCPMTHGCAGSYGGREPRKDLSRRHRRRASVFSRHRDEPPVREGGRKPPARCLSPS